MSMSGGENTLGRAIRVGMPTEGTTANNRGSIAKLGVFDPRGRRNTENTVADLDTSMLDEP
jgi:hypothetical protein